MPSSLVRLCIGAAAMTVAYFAVPVQVDGQFLVRLLVTVGGVALATWFIWRQVRYPGSPIWRLALGVVAGVLVFASADYWLATSSPGQFVDLNTRLDALYFALTTLATVGYGDVHAEGQVARGLITVQLIFNVAVLATAASIMSERLRSRRRERERGGR